MMQNEWKHFEKMTQNWNLYYFGAKGGSNWTSEVNILHKSKSTSNDHVKQYWWETCENFFQKVTKVQNFDLV